MKQLNTILPESESARKWIAVFVTVLLAGLLTTWTIYGAGEYGIALFIFTPLFIGVCPAIIFGYKRGITKRQSFDFALLSLILLTFGLLAFAMEGLICIAMVFPIALLITWVGSLIGYFLIKDIIGLGPSALVILVFAIPCTAFFESLNKEEAVVEVTTEIEINAHIQTVWEQVVEFPKLREPKEFLFKAGIAYPVSAEIEGFGVGSIRRCNFSTGSFIEPITVWDEPNILEFDVVENPAPMKEISFWDVNAPHLHDYFVSKKGQFKLTELTDGRTLLEGTTWYTHDIKPVFYWRLWSDYIVHSIHKRVLNHIKETSEKQ